MSSFLVINHTCIDRDLNNLAHMFLNSYAAYLLYVGKGKLCSWLFARYSILWTHLQQTSFEKNIVGKGEILQLIPLFRI